MEITIEKKLGKIQKGARAVSAWRTDPGNFQKSLRAALHYARRDNKQMIVIPGNSYNQKVFHIASEGESVKKYTVQTHNNPVVVVSPQGDVFQAIAND